MLLRIKKLSKTYGGKDVLSDVNLSVSEDSIVCLTGSNGSGKTTLLDIICGITRCDAGTILFQERDVTGVAPWRIARMGVTRTFQEIKVFDNLTPLENLIVSLPVKTAGSWAGLFFRPLSAYREKKELIEKAETFNKNWLKHLPDGNAVNLSLGERKMLEIVKSICRESKLVMFDEPVSALSLEYKKAVIRIIKQLRQKGTSILFIEHDYDVIAELADYVYFLEEGRISFSGSRADFFSMLKK